MTEFKDKINPMVLADGTIYPHTVLLKNVVTNPQIKVGDYTYYNDFDLVYGDDYERKIAPYLYEGVPGSLIIGKFCSIAHNVKFLTSTANHQYDGFSAYPFAVFGQEWSKSYQPNYPISPDNEVGHDVWIGHNATIMPGVKIGSGAIIGAGAIVTKNVPDYCIAAGNPAKIIRQRFDDETIKKLLEIQWWNWPKDKIFSNIEHIVGQDIEKLMTIHKEL